MPQNPATANQIINEAFHMIGELSPDEIIKAPALKTGLIRLNRMLEWYATKGVYIPFFTEFTFQMVAGQKEYTVSNVITANITAERIIELDFVNLERDNVNYPVRIVPETEIYTNVVYQNTQSIPALVTLVRQVRFSKLVFYPVPDNAYTCIVRGKSMLDKIELFDDLEELPPYYFRFLEYALARELLNFYPSANWSPMMEKEYQIMFKDIMAANDLDMTIWPSNDLMYPYDRAYFGSLRTFP